MDVADGIAEAVPSKASVATRLGKLREKVVVSGASDINLESLLEACGVQAKRAKRNTIQDEDALVVFGGRSLSDIGELASLAVKPDDFDPVRDIGAGGFGAMRSRVQLVRNKSSGELLAMKAVPKAAIVDAERICRERNILSSGSKNPWILRLKYAFQDGVSCYLVTDFCSGGDLKGLIQRHSDVFPEDMSRFYVSELVLALHSLHKLGFAHCDLRPENVLIDQFGHIRLADFGAAEPIDKHGNVNRTFSPCTPSVYSAPEIDDHVFNGEKADFWSLGLVLFEMATGQLPAPTSPSRRRLAGVAWREHVSKFSADLALLMEGLLEEKVENRLDFNKIVRHSFFSTIDWDTVATDCTPFIPSLESDTDTSYFRLVAPESPKSPRRGARRSDFPVILGFSFSSEHTLEALRRQFGSSSSASSESADLLSSLRRQNEDLRSRLAKIKSSDSKPWSAEDKDSGLRLQKLCEKEGQEMRETVARLEKLLDLERNERAESEQKTLKLLAEVKAKWRVREEKQLGELRRELEEAAERRAEDARANLASVIEAQKEEIGALKDVKGALKNKLRECRVKLEASIGKCEEEKRKNQLLQDEQIASSQVKFSSAKIAQDLAAKEQEFRKKTESLEGQIEELRNQLEEEREKQWETEKRAKAIKMAAENAELKFEKDLRELKEANKILQNDNGLLRKDLDDLSKENDETRTKMRQKDDKLSDLEGVLKTLENKVRPLAAAVAENSNNRQDSAEVTKLKEELGLQKVEVRLLERKLKDSESRLKFVREVMLKDERESKEKLQQSLKELEEKLEEARSKEQDFCKENRERELKLADLEKRLSPVKRLQKKVEMMETAEQEKERLSERLRITEELLESAKARGDDAASVRANYETMKHACLELQDQIAEYEKVVARLESSVETVKKENERLREKAREVNELKSALALVNLKLKDVQEKYDDAEKLYHSQEEILKKKLSSSTLTKAEQSQTLEQVRNQMSALAKNYDILSSETETLKDQNVHLKEENFKVSSNVQSLRESNLKLHAVMEEMLEKMASKNAELQGFRDRLEAATHDLEQKEMESSVQIKQLKKLVDHLQQKTAGGKKSSSTSDCKNWSAAMPYEELQELLVKEQGRIKRLEEDVRRLRQERAAASAGDAAKKRSDSNLPPLLVTTKTQHAIPHRFHKQTNIKSGLKCFVCQSSITLLTTASACRFCARAVHPVCEAAAPKDCGLPTDLAKVLGGGTGGSGSDIASGGGAVVEIMHRGYLRVPSSTSEWRTVAVHLSVDGKLVVEGGSKSESIDLRPSRGSVHIQSCVAYAELLHTGAFDEAHVFKVVLVRVARVREVHYFCAKNMQEKNAWIDAIEKAAALASSIPSNTSSDLRKWSVLTTLPPEAKIFCALRLTREILLVGTSEGLQTLRENESDHGKYLTSMKSIDAESVYQMEHVHGASEILIVLGCERRLMCVDSNSLLTSSPLAMRQIECLRSCHLLSVRDADDEGVLDDVLVCAADDCRVSLLSRSAATGEYSLLYAFSTDQPTMCVRFLSPASNAVLVATNSVYKIDLTSLEVCEFLEESLRSNLALSLASEDQNALAAMFSVSSSSSSGKGEESVLLAFADSGVFVDEEGRASARKDLRWLSHTMSQFFVARRREWTGAMKGRTGLHMWMASHESVLCLPVDDDLGRGASEMAKLRSPQIVCAAATQGEEDVVLLVERRQGLVVVLKQNDLR